MQCPNPVYLKEQDIFVPCGKCIDCRVRRATEWKIRIMNQLEAIGNKGQFVTLTYDNENVPVNYYNQFARGIDNFKVCKDLSEYQLKEFIGIHGTLVKKDLQNYFKRLRKSLKGRKFKYYACGEYGGQHGRPHYHVIFMGLDFLSDEDVFYVKKNWQCGTVYIGYASKDSVNYTTDYICNKFMAKDQEEVRRHYGFDREVPFQVQSCGIGSDYINNRSDFKETGKMRYRGNEMALPRYYINKLGVDEDILERNRAEMQEREREKFKLKEEEIYSEDQLQAYRQRNKNLFKRINIRHDRKNAFKQEKNNA